MEFIKNKMNKSIFKYILIAFASIAVGQTKITPGDK